MKKYLIISLIILSCSKQDILQQIEEMPSIVQSANGEYIIDGDITLDSLVNNSTTFGEATLTDGGNAVTATVHIGKLIRRNGDGPALDIRNPLSVVTFIGDIESSGRGIEARGTLNITGNITASQEGIRMNGAHSDLTYRGNILSYGYGIMASSTYDFLNTAIIRGQIHSTHNSALAIYGATVDVDSSTVTSDYYFGLETGGARLTAKNSYFISKGHGLNGFAFFDYTPDNGSFAKFDNVGFISSVYSIGAQGSYVNRMPFIFLSKCFYNAPIQVLGSGIAPYNWVGYENLIYRKNVKIRR